MYGKKYVCKDNNYQHDDSSSEDMKSEKSEESVSQYPRSRRS